jgi:hypothetical protein
MKIVPLGLTVLVILSGAWPLFAQHCQPDVLKALKIESPIKLDGVLDEPAWAKAQPISNFTQRELNENAPATERTEVAVLYNRKELYIGVWCFDSANVHFVLNQFGETLNPSWRLNKTVAMIKFVWYFGTK